MSGGEEIPLRVAGWPLATEQSAQSVHSWILLTLGGCAVSSGGRFAVLLRGVAAEVRAVPGILRFAAGVLRGAKVRVAAVHIGGLLAFWLCQSLLAAALPGCHHYLNGVAFKQRP